MSYDLYKLDTLRGSFVTSRMLLGIEQLVSHLNNVTGVGACL